MKAFKKVFKLISDKISNFIFGSLLVGGAFLGITKDKNGYNTKQLETAGWTLIFGIPFLLLVFPNLIIPFWSMLILFSLILINIDNGLMLIYLISEHGIATIRKIKNLEEWKQGFYQSEQQQ